MEVSIRRSDGFVPFSDPTLWVSLRLCQRLRPKRRGLVSLAGFHLRPRSSLLHPVRWACVLVFSTSGGPEPVLNTGHLVSDLTPLLGQKLNDELFRNIKRF